MKRVWQPLGIMRCGIAQRLYSVRLYFHKHPHWNKELVVAANSPSHAAALVEKSYQGTEWIEEPVIKGNALNVFQPEVWFEGEDQSDVNNCSHLWTPVTEAWPELNTPVLFYFSDGHQAVGWRVSDWEHWYKHHPDDTITHWQPLPASPKEE